MLSKFYHLALLITLNLFSCYALAIDCSHYPHWQDCHHNQQLAKIDAFITRYAHQHYAAAFDWDGTLFSEHIPAKHLGQLTGQTFAGQPLWMIWSATQLSTHPNWFPLFQTADQQGRANLINANLYTEGKTNATLGDYSKFSQIAAYPAGMTPQTIAHSVTAYLQHYAASRSVFLPMMDLLQRLQNEGYQLWIITGSNPYYVASVLHHIEQQYHFHLGILPTPYTPDHPGHIIGNTTKLAQNGTFSLVYDNRYTLSPHSPAIHLARYTVDQAGKARAIQYYAEPHAHRHIILYGGNSAGDYQAASYILDRHRAHPDVPGFVIAVNAPQNTLGTLKDLVSTPAESKHAAIVSLQ